jgi:cytochrome b subunit of formate dehydrogenase
MEWLRVNRTPWGAEYLLGLSWNWVWVALALGVAAIAFHLALHRRAPWRPAAALDPALLERLPRHVPRHTAAARLYHWTLAAAVTALGATAFLPIAGVTFHWVAPHWIAGLVLAGAIAFHVGYTLRRRSLRWVRVSAGEVARAWAARVRGVPPPLPGKYPLAHRFFHHATAAALAVTLLSGAVLLARVETPWWDANPYLLPPEVWGVVYLLHGIGAVALIPLVMVHVYLALRPDRRWLTLSIFRGWIPRERYLERFDPLRWWPGADPAPAPEQRGPASGPSPLG